MNMFSIDNLKKVISIGAKIGNVGGKVYADGKIGLSDLAHVPEFISALRKISEVDWRQVVPEAKDLQAEEVEELIFSFREEFNIPQTGSEIKIEEVLSIISQLVACVISLVGVFTNKTVPEAKTIYF